MQVNETSNEGLSRAYAVTIPAADLDARLNSQLEGIKGQVQIKGFRPGKVPLSHLKQTYGKQVMGDVITNAVQETSQKVLEEREITPASQPSIEITNFEEGGDLEYAMTIDVMPDIPDADFSKIKLERQVISDKDLDAEVEKAMQKLAEGNTSYEPCKAGSKAKKDDQVRFDFKGAIDGEVFDGGAAEDYMLVLGSGSFIPGFEDQLIGAKADEDLEINISFPEDYPASELAGKEAIFECKIKEILAPVKSDIDDAFAAKFGMENVDALREVLSGRVRQDFDGVSKEKLKRKLLDSLDELYTFDLPERMLENEAKTVAQHLSENDDDGEEGHDHEHDHEEKEVEVTDEHTKIASRRVKLGLALAEVGRENEIQVGEEEVQRKLMEEACRHPGQEQQFLQRVRDNPQMADQFRAPLFEDKVVDFILELAKVSETQVSKDELLAEPEED